ncbi:MAG: response regulator [Clostridiales bacterium]|jgi:YesN/AraC family two-component response regulator|nr:response regulator [Clostridiales bacterium]
MNLLIVDDEIIAIKALLAAVNWQNYGIAGDVYEAHNTAEALNIMSSQTVDVILCDIEMPGENGIEFIRKVRASGADAAIVFLTCHAKFEYAQEAIRLGCEDYILTPAPYENIAETVQKSAQKILAARENRQIAKYGAQWLNEKREKTQDKQKPLTPKDLTGEVTAYILSHLSDEDLSVTQIANRYFLNEDYISRVFKREKGVSIKRFIIMERMELAKRLLNGTAVSVTAVAEQTGYSTYSYFEAAFSKYYGCTPTSMLNKNK